MANSPARRIIFFIPWRRHVLENISLDILTLLEENNYQPDTDQHVEDTC